MRRAVPRLIRSSEAVITIQNVGCDRRTLASIVIRVKGVREGCLGLELTCNAGDAFRGSVCPRCSGWAWHARADCVGEGTSQGRAHGAGSAPPIVRGGPLERELICRPAAKKLSGAARKGRGGVCLAGIVAVPDLVFTRGAGLAGDGPRLFAGVASSVDTAACVAVC